MDCLVVGAGSVAHQYLPDLYERSSISVAAVCDLDADRARRVAATYETDAYTDFETALASEAAPLVLNLTSHTAHATVTRRALEGDRHVFSEKPLALEASTATELVALAAERRLALGCAPTNPTNPAQRRAARLLADGRAGRVRIGDATANVGRVTDWHDRPESFLAVGPLFDGGVYPLTLLVALFGPVERVRCADASRPWPDRERRRPEAPTHVEAVVEHRDGPRVQLTASLYAPHRAREFYGLELHGDDGSLYIDDTGALTDSDDRVQFGRTGRSYTAVPPTTRQPAGGYADGPARLADSIRRGDPERASARRGAHVVAVCEAIEHAAETGGSVTVDSVGTARDRVAAPTYRPPERPPARSSLRLPPVGALLRDRATEDVEALLDSGYRLLVAEQSSAEAAGAALSGPGTPERSSLHLSGVVPAKTDVESGVDGLSAELGRPLDSVLVADPTGRRLAAAKSVHDSGTVRAIGPIVESLTDDPCDGSVVVTTERPRPGAIAAQHGRGTRVLARLDDPTAVVDERATTLAERHDVSALRVAIARAVQRGLVPVVGAEFETALAGAGTALADAATVGEGVPDE